MPISYPVPSEIVIDLLEDFEFMGKQETGDYVYYGYKKWGKTKWRIARKDTTDESAWQFAFGATGWQAAWADPAALSYGDPPDA